MLITNVGSAAFWIMIAAIVIAGDWLRARREALKHETLRQIIEKTGNVDEAQLKALFQPPTPGWLREPPLGSGYRTLRVLGTIVISMALGLTLFFSILWLSSPARHDSALIGFASTSVVALIGMGLFVASRFLPPPPRSDRGDHT
jgi:hypothetical protein